MKRYTLLFSINGGAYAIVTWAAEHMATTERLSRAASPKPIAIVVAIAASLFTALMFVDLWLFGRMMKKGGTGDGLDYFGGHGKAVLAVPRGIGLPYPESGCPVATWCSPSLSHRRDGRADSALSLAKTTSDPLRRSHSLQGIARGAGLTLSAPSHVDGSRSPVDQSGKRERCGSCRADQSVGRGLTRLDECTDDGGHPPREAVRPCPPPALRRASRGARPCRARDGFAPGDSTRSTRSGCDAGAARRERRYGRGTRAAPSR
jgi:hypothetical protein